MSHRAVSLIMLLFIACLAMAEEMIDITSRFTYCWGTGEQATRNNDGSITYVATKWGGLCYWVDSDWTDYDRVVFKFKEPTPCAVQPIIHYEEDPWKSAYYQSGVTEAVLELDAQQKHYVQQLALQAADAATITIQRIYLVKNTEDVTDPDEEQDARLMINELMQSNVDCVMDDLNDFPDSWVELYNGGTTAARLYRYSLGITPDPDDAWPLPDRKIKAGGHVLVYCDKVASGLHTSFRLESGKGGGLFLFRDGQLIDEVSNLQKQPAPNISFGRSTDGSAEWGYQLKSTPAEPNSGEVCDGDHILGQPVFSRAGCVTTNQQIIHLQLSVPEDAPQGTEIRYTLDGTEPTEESTRYNAPLVFNENRTVRAKLFCPGWLSPPSTTHSYILFPRELTLPVVSIVTDNRYLNNSRLGIFTNNTSDKRVDWRRPINIEFFFDEGESSINQLCETRIAGAASRGAQKKSMALYAHKRFGTKRFDYEFFPDQCPGLKDYKSLVLRNAGNDFDYLYMRDALVQRVMATHTDLDWQAWRPAIVYVNGQYYSMLNIRERANENNVYTHYDGLEDIDLIENWGDLKEGTWDNYNRFKEFYKEEGHTMAEFEQWMDCKEFINLMMMNLYFNNFDFPGNNIIMWRSRNSTGQTGEPTDGRWRWIAKDCDYTIGIYGQGPTNYKILEWLYNPNYDSALNWGANSSSATRLFRRLMDDNDFKREFTDRCAIYMGDFLNEEGIHEIWDPMYDLIKYEYPYHRQLINQWWPNYNEELEKAREWIAWRTEQFYSQLADFYQTGKPVPMNVYWSAEDTDTEVGIVFNGVRLSKGIFNGKYFVGRNLTLEGVSGGGMQVSGWQIQKNTNGSIETSEVSGPLLSMQMPQCSRLIIHPVLTQVSAIEQLAQRQWTWQRNDQSLQLSGVPEGLHVRLYDLRGMLLAEVRSDGQNICLPVAQGKTYVLKVGDKVVKL